MEEENKNEIQETKQEEVHTEKEIKKKNNKVVLIILCIALFMVGIGVGLLLTNVFNSKSEEKKNNNQTEEKETNSNIENEEKKETTSDKETSNPNNDMKDDDEREISEEKIINTLSTKFTKLFGDYINILGQNDKSSLFGRYLEWRASFNEIKDPPQNGDYAYYVGELPYDTVNKDYYDLFGENIEKNTAFEGTCANTKYNSDNNSFVIRKLGCDAGWGWFVRNYNYKYTEDKNNVYIYTAVAVYSGMDEIEILTDQDTKKVYKVIKNSEDFHLDETNYESFAKYRITFKKADNNYYYTGIEKIENGK